MISYMSRIFRVQVEREEPSLSWENREDVVVRYTDEITDAAHLFGIVEQCSIRTANRINSEENILQRPMSCVDDERDQNLKNLSHLWGNGIRKSPCSRMVE